jgi:hypothetical protein
MWLDVLNAAGEIEESWSASHKAFKQLKTLFSTLGTPAQPLSVGLGQSPRCVHQRRSCPHQSGSRPNHREIRLRFRAMMLHRTQQLRIDPGQPRQRSRIHAIVFLPALPNQTKKTPIPRKPSSTSDGANSTCADATFCCHQ